MSTIIAGQALATGQLPLAGLRFIVIARLSKKPKPGENVEFPIQVQDQRARAWGESQGGEYIGTAADYKSGTVPPWLRPHTKEWVDESGDKIRSYDAAVAIMTDRISRGTDEDFSMIEAWAVRNHKKLIIASDSGGGIWYPARHDSDFWQWTATKRQARKEWEADRERSMNRQADLRKSKKLSGGSIPFGYVSRGTKYDKTIVPTDIGRKWVPLIFERVKKGIALATIARWLDAEGVKPKYSKKWSPQTIRQMIRNRTYIGERRCDEVVDGKRRRGGGVTILDVEAIVDTGLWLEANQKLNNAMRGGRRGPKNWEPALCTGRLKCGRCGAPMYRLKVRGGYVYYRCHGHLPNPRGCGWLVYESIVDGIVDEVMRKNDKPLISWQMVQGTATEIHLAMDKVNLALYDLPSKRLTWDVEDAERSRLRAEYRKLEKELEGAAPDHWEKTVVLKDNGESLLECDRWNEADLAGRREILKDMTLVFFWREIDGERQPIVTIEREWPKLEPQLPESDELA